MKKENQLTLGELINIIKYSDCYRNREKYTKKYDDESNVVFDFGTAFPSGIGSWRGDYSQLAIKYTLSGYDGEQFAHTSVSEFLKMLEECEGKEFTGWKGGEFVMTKDTPLWVDNDGNCSQTIVSGMIDREYQIVIETRFSEW